MPGRNGIGQGREEFCDFDSAKGRYFRTTVIASRRVGARRRPMTGSAKQSIARCAKKEWIASSLTLLAMTLRERDYAPKTSFCILPP
jgi:hypothetical protein